MSVSKVKQLEQLKLKQSKRAFTRAKAERALSEGANPADVRFTKHSNYHIRLRSWKLLGSILPSDPAEAQKLMDDLHIKPKKVEAVEPTTGDTRSTEEQIASV